MTQSWYNCHTDYFCDDSKKITWRVDYTQRESIRNLITQLNLYCSPDYIIGLLGASFLLGIVIGCSTLTRLGDKHGRKPIYMIGIVLNLCFVLGVLFVNNLLLVFGLIFVFGLSVSARYYVGYTYNIEMQPKSHYVLVSTTMFVAESVIYLLICIYFWFLGKNWKLLQIPNVLLSVFGLVFLC